MNLVLLDLDRGFCVEMRVHRFVVDRMRPLHASNTILDWDMVARFNHSFGAYALRGEVFRGARSFSEHASHRILVICT